MEPNCCALNIKPKTRPRWSVVVLLANTALSEG